MKKQIISFPVKPITDIAELSAPDGARQLDFPYFVSMDTGWEIHTINERTDPATLMKLIEAKQVFVYFDINQ